MKVEVAIGEVFDKITILDIKLERIKDEERAANIRKERQILSDALEAENLTDETKLYDNLREINEKIWDTEAGFREKIASQTYDQEFIQYAIDNAKYNDERFLAKKKINEYYMSGVKEEKSYDRLYTSD